MREDIYGLRDDMLQDNLLQKEYIEIDVFPGYYAPGPTRVLPQLFLVEERQGDSDRVGQDRLLTSEKFFLSLIIEL